MRRHIGKLHYFEKNQESTFGFEFLKKKKGFNLVYVDGCQSESISLPRTDENRLIVKE